MNSSSFKRGGFSLIEIVIAVAIFAFAILVIVGLMGTSLKVTRDSEEKIQAANLAQVISARFQAMCISKFRGENVNGNSPIALTVTASGPGKFQSTGGTFVDALGNKADNSTDGVFGIKSDVWKESVLATKADGVQLVHCSIQLAWPVAAVAADGDTNTYTMTTSFLVTP